MSLGTKTKKDHYRKQFLLALFFLEILAPLINLSQLIFIALSYIHKTKSWCLFSWKNEELLLWYLWVNELN